MEEHFNLDFDDMVQCICDNVKENGVDVSPDLVRAILDAETNCIMEVADMYKGEEL